MTAIWNENDVVISIGNQIMTGKDCILKQVTINRHANFEQIEGSLIHLAPAPIEIELNFICNSDAFVHELMNEDFIPKIRNKKVDDCDIRELLFAIRSKISNQKRKDDGQTKMDKV